MANNNNNNLRNPKRFRNYTGDFDDEEALFRHICDIESSCDGSDGDDSEDDTEGLNLSPRTGMGQPFGVGTSRSGPLDVGTSRGEPFRARTRRSGPFGVGTSRSGPLDVRTSRRDSGLNIPSGMGMGQPFGVGTSRSGPLGILGVGTSRGEPLGVTGVGTSRGELFDARTIRSGMLRSLGAGSSRTEPFGVGTSRGELFGGSPLRSEVLRFLGAGSSRAEPFGVGTSSSEPLGVTGVGSSRGEPSSSNVAVIGFEEDCEEAGDTRSKRPRVDTSSLDWGTQFERRTHHVTRSRDVVGDEDNSRNDNEGSDSDSRMDLTDDLLHMVLSFLDHIDLCQAAGVCKQWRDASSHEDFWRYLNFENRRISAQQFDEMCRRYPNATAVNLYGTPTTFHPLEMIAVSSLRNLEALTLGKRPISESFFLAIPNCHMLKTLTINDASLGNTTMGFGFQEISINHENLRDIHIVKCRVIRVSVGCPQLETLSLRRSSMPHVILNCPLLRELDIASCHKLSDAAIRSAATSCPILESLDMSMCSAVSDETLRIIADTCLNLQILDASYCPNISFELVRLTMLTVLKLHNCDGITSASMAAIAGCTSLEVLELDNCKLLTSVSMELQCLQSISLVHCRKFIDLNIRSKVLSSVTVNNCPVLRRISITSDALTKLVLQKQESLSTLELQCPSLQEVDLSECDSLKDSICDVFNSGGGCPLLRSLILDYCEGVTAVRLCSISLVNLSFVGCRGLTFLELRCPNVECISLHCCDHLEEASFSSVGLKSLNLGICPKLRALYIEAPVMVSLELKGCGVLSQASVHCPLLTSLDASFCSQLKDGCLSASASSCPLIESLVLMSCPSVGPDGLSSLRCLLNLTHLDLSYTFLTNLQPVFDSCLYLKVLVLQACKYLDDASLEPIYKYGALPALLELDLSYGTLCQSAIEELLAGCTRLTHVSLNGCLNMHDLDWGSHGDKLSDEISTFFGSKNYSLENHTEDQAIRLLQNLNCVGCPNIKKVVIPSAARWFHLSSLNLSLSSNLKEVDISCCNLSSLNLSNCLTLEILKLDCPRLTGLFLQSCNIEEDYVEAAIQQCSMLETLDVRFCPKISQLRVRSLRAACPSLKRLFSSSAPSCSSN